MIVPGNASMIRKVMYDAYLIYLEFSNVIIVKIAQMQCYRKCMYKLFHGIRFSFGRFIMSSCVRGTF